MAFVNGERQGSSNISLPVSSTDNAVVRWDGVTGTIIQDSGVLVSDTDQIEAPGGWKVT